MNDTSETLGSLFSGGRKRPGRRRLAGGLRASGLHGAVRPGAEQDGQSSRMGDSASPMSTRERRDRRTGTQAGPPIRREASKLLDTTSLIDLAPRRHPPSPNTVRVPGSQPRGDRMRAIPENTADQRLQRISRGRGGDKPEISLSRVVSCRRRSRQDFRDARPRQSGCEI